MEPIVDDEYLFGLIERESNVCRFCVDLPRKRAPICPHDNRIKCHYCRCSNEGWWITYRRCWGYE